MTRRVPLLLGALGLVLAGCASPTTETSDPLDDTAAATSPSPQTPSPSSSPSAEPSPSPSEGATTAEPSTKPGKEQKKSKKKESKPKPSRPGTKVLTAASQFGPVLFDGARQAIYLFDKERGSRPACYGACADAWPPVLTDGQPIAGGAVRARLLGTTERRDGSTQVTYAGHPLYYYAHEGPNQVLCHDVPGFGGLWLALKASGVRAD